MIHRTFDDASEEVLKPTHTTAAVPGFPGTVMVLFSERMIDILREDGACEVISHLHAGGSVPIYKTSYGGKEMAFYLTRVGGPATVAMMEDAIAKGARRFLIFGSCGTLDQALTAGHVIVPTWAYRDEGTSYHYMHADSGPYVEVKTANRLAEILRALKVPHTCGRTWTTDAIYRETRNNVRRRREDGCLVVEMECASVMAMAQFRGIEAYQFLYAADNLDADDWDARILGAMPEEVRERIVRIGREVAARL